MESIPQSKSKQSTPSEHVIQSESEYVPSDDEFVKVQEQQPLLKLQRKNLDRASFNSKSWTLTQNILYKSFLCDNIDWFSRPLRQKKALKINIRMSEFIGTRSSYQCRSHHQKMLKYHRTIPAIISLIQNQEKQLQAKEIKKLRAIYNSL